MDLGRVVLFTPFGGVGFSVKLLLWVVGSVSYGAGLLYGLQVGRGKALEAKVRELDAA